MKRIKQKENVRVSEIQRKWLKEKKRNQRRERNWERRNVLKKTKKPQENKGGERKQCRGYGQTVKDGNKGNFEKITENKKIKKKLKQ